MSSLARSRWLFPMGLRTNFHQRIKYIFPPRYEKLDNIRGVKWTVYLPRHSDVCNKEAYAAIACARIVSSLIGSFLRRDYPPHALYVYISRNISVTYHGKQRNGNIIRKTKTFAIPPKRKYPREREIVEFRYPSPFHLSFSLSRIRPFRYFSLIPVAGGKLHDPGYRKR